MFDSDSDSDYSQKCNDSGIGIVHHCIKLLNLRPVQPSTCPHATLFLWSPNYLVCGARQNFENLINDVTNNCRIPVSTTENPFVHYLQEICQTHSCSESLMKICPPGFHLSLILLLCYPLAQARCYQIRPKAFLTATQALQ